MLETTRQFLVYILDVARADPIHFVVELLLGGFVVYLLLQKSFKPRREELTAAEQDELIDLWEPEPLESKLTDQQRMDIETIPEIEGLAGEKIVVNGTECVNLATTNFLGMVQEKSVIDRSVAAVEKYGCGACGPRGFYGTLDIHLEMEKRICSFLGTEGACVYSSGYTTSTSVIPAFSQRGDMIFCDAGANHGLKSGCVLARSHLSYFKHNDMEDLASLLEEVIATDRRTKRKITRRWIVVEGIYIDSGEILTLPRLVALAKKYRFRIILDESNALGVLGKTGRGSMEHHGVPTSDVDIILADMGRSLNSNAGFCTGAREISEHQRLNGSGYVFSASLPPYLCASAIASLDCIEKEPERVARLREHSKAFHKLATDRLEASHAADRYALQLHGDPESPIKHLRLRSPAPSRIENEQRLQTIVEEARSVGVALSRAKYSSILLDRRAILPDPSIRISLSSEIPITDIEDVVEKLTKVIANIGSLKDVGVAAASS